MVSSTTGLTGPQIKQSLIEDMNTGTSLMIKLNKTGTECHQAMSDCIASQNDNAKAIADLAAKVEIINKVFKSLIN